MRKIIHVDMDCFFAAVEMRDNPALRDIPIAIGGSRERRGVISTANYPARKFGVRSAMPTGMALKLCPHLTLLPGRFDAYKEASNHIREIFSRYTSRIEPLSLDEAYLDVTDSVHCHGSATLIAQEIRQTIFNELQLTASAGVAPVK
ncbi:DNA polymerase IV, partial [Klebsiella pneumoniae]